MFFKFTNKPYYIFWNRELHSSSCPKLVLICLLYSTPLEILQQFQGKCNYAGCWTCMQWNRLLNVESVYLIYIYQWLQHLISNWSTPIDYIATSRNLLSSFFLHTYSKTFFLRWKRQQSADCFFFFHCKKFNYIITQLFI